MAVGRTHGNKIKRNDEQFARHPWSRIKLVRNRHQRERRAGAEAEKPHGDGLEVLEREQDGGGDEDDVAGAAAAGQERREKLAEETDDLLDEIDDVLEENAEDFVRAYVQKGGQ